MWYLCLFYHRYLAFRQPEVESMAKMYGCAEGDVEWKLPDGFDEESPLWFVRLPSEQVARQVASRCILVRGLFELWGDGADHDALEAAVRAYPVERREPFLVEASTFKVNFFAFSRKISADEANVHIKRLAYVDFKGRVLLSGTSQDHRFWLIQTGPVSNHDKHLPQCLPERLLFAREVAVCDRSAIHKLELSRRKYIGPTSMDTEMSLLIANQALARPGTLVYDPFCGTGSMLVAAAHYGAHTLGADIDIRVIRDGRKGNNVWSNFADYGLPAPLGLLRCDNSRLPFRKGWGSVFDAVVGDPPYGVRAAGRKSGGRKLLLGRAQIEDYVIPADKRADHIPSTAPYLMDECLFDLLETAARGLRVGGRLVYFLPVSAAVPLAQGQELSDASGNGAAGLEERAAGGAAGEENGSEGKGDGPPAGKRHHPSTPSDSPKGGDQSEAAGVEGEDGGVGMAVCLPPMPQHRCLRLVAASTQMLASRWGRCLVTMEKCEEYGEQDAAAAAERKEEFRRRMMQEGTQGMPASADAGAGGVLPVRESVFAAAATITTVTEAVAKGVPGYGCALKFRGKNM